MEDERKSFSPEPVKRRNGSCSPPPQKKMSLCNGHTSNTNNTSTAASATPCSRTAAAGFPSAAASRTAAAGVPSAAASRTAPAGVPPAAASKTASGGATVSASSGQATPSVANRLPTGSINGTSQENGSCSSISPGTKMTAVCSKNSSSLPGSSLNSRKLTAPVNGNSSESSPSTATVSPSAKGTAAAVVCPTAKMPTASSTAKPAPNPITPTPKSNVTPVKPSSSSNNSIANSASSGGGERVKNGTAAIMPSTAAGGSSKCEHHSASAAAKFQPREDLVKQIMDMGICRNGAVKALYWTGNKSALAASNWIFDQPERDLDTPLEDELEMIRAQQLEREREEIEREKAYSRIVRRVHHNHIHHHLHEEHMLDEEFLEDLHDHEDLDDEEDDDEDEDEDEDDEDDELDMDFKMVFVINRSLDITPGQMTMSVSKATAGLFRKIYSQAQSAMVGPDELAMWADFGERTVILWADTEQHIKDLELMAKSLRLPCYMVETFAELKGSDSRAESGGGAGPRPEAARCSMDYRLIDQGGKALYKSVLGLFGEERELNKVTGRLKVVP